MQWDFLVFWWCSYLSPLPIACHPTRDVPAPARQTPLTPLYNHWNPWDPTNCSVLQLFLGLKQKKIGKIIYLFAFVDETMSKWLKPANKRKQVAPDRKPFVARLGLEGTCSYICPVPLCPSPEKASRRGGWALSPHLAAWFWTLPPASHEEDVGGRQGWRSPTNQQNLFIAVVLRVPPSAVPRVTLAQMQPGQRLPWGH